MRALAPACLALSLSGCVQGFWSDPDAGDDTAGHNDDVNPAGTLPDEVAPPACQSSSAPVLVDDLLVIKQRTAYDSQRGTLLVVAMLSGQDQHGFIAARVALDGTVLEQRDILPELQRDEAQPWQLVYAASEDQFGLVILVEHINQGGELRFVRLRSDGEPVEEPALFDTTANDAAIAWDHEDRVWGLAWTRQGAGGGGELVARTGNPPTPDAASPVLGTTEFDYGESASIGRCHTCAGAFVVQDGANNNVVLDAAGTRVDTAGPRAFGDFDATLLGGDDAFFAVSVLGGGTVADSVLQLEADIGGDEPIASNLPLPGNAFTGRAFLEPDGGIIAVAFGYSEVFDVARGDASGWSGVRLRHQWGAPQEGRVVTDVVDAVLTDRGLLAIHTPPSSAVDGTLAAGIVVTHLCAP